MLNPDLVSLLLTSTADGAVPTEAGAAPSGESAAFADCLLQAKVAPLAIDDTALTEGLTEKKLQSDEGVDSAEAAIFASLLRGTPWLPLQPEAAPQVAAMSATTDTSAMSQPSDDMPVAASLPSPLSSDEPRGGQDGTQRTGLLPLDLKTQSLMTSDGVAHEPGTAPIHLMATAAPNPSSADAEVETAESRAHTSVQSMQVFIQGIDVKGDVALIASAESASDGADQDPRVDSANESALSSPASLVSAGLQAAAASVASMPSLPVARTAQPERASDRTLGEHDAADGRVAPSIAPDAPLRSVDTGPTDPLVVASTFQMPMPTRHESQASTSSPADSAPMTADAVMALLQPTPASSTAAQASQPLTPVTHMEPTNIDSVLLQTTHAQRTPGLNTVVAQPFEPAASAASDAAVARDQVLPARPAAAVPSKVLSPSGNDVTWQGRLAPTPTLQTALQPVRSSEEKPSAEKSSTEKPAAVASHGPGLTAQSLPSQTDSQATHVPVDATPMPDPTRTPSYVQTHAAMRELAAPVSAGWHAASTSPTPYWVGAPEPAQSLKVTLAQDDQRAVHIDVEVSADQQRAWVQLDGTASAWLHRLEGAQDDLRHQFRDMGVDLQSARSLSSQAHSAPFGQGQSNTGSGSGGSAPLAWLAEASDAGGVREPSPSQPSRVALSDASIHLRA